MLELKDFTSKSRFRVQFSNHKNYNFNYDLYYQQHCPNKVEVQKPYNTVSNQPVHESDQSEASKHPCAVTSQPQVTSSLVHYIQYSSLKPEKLNILGQKTDLDLD